jgi:ABC-type proline/glycine betaine transport system permease subunit
MDSTLTSIIIAVSVAIGVGIAMALQGKKNRSLAALIEPLLRERGAMTLPALAEALGMGSFLSRGKVAMALNELCTAGTVVVIPAPEGTAQLDKVNHIQYRWRA